MIRVEMLPASFGDALWIEYDGPDRTHRLLIDGGLAVDAPMLRQRIALEDDPVRFDLAVITHIDRDHINGMYRLLGDLPQGVTLDDVWFNGRRHLPRGTLDVATGEALSTRLTELKLPWNEAFNGKAVVVPSKGPLPSLTLPGGAVITLLSPTKPKLEALARVWDREVTPELGTLSRREDGMRGVLRAAPRGPVKMDELLAAEFAEDDTAPNGSSIAFLLEHKGARVLLGADAHPGVLCAALDRLGAARAPIRLDAFKLSHHGSAANVCDALLSRIECAHFLVSTNGGTYYHPDRAAIARVVKRCPGATLFFNYRSKFNEIWNDAVLKRTWRYETEYPVEGELGIAFEVT